MKNLNKKNEKTEEEMIFEQVNNNMCWFTAGVYTTIAAYLVSKCFK